MYIQTQGGRIACAAGEGGGGWSFRGAGVEDAAGPFALYADDGALLRTFAPEDWLRTVRGEGVLTLTNSPAPAPAEQPSGAPEPLPEAVNAQAIAELSVLLAGYQAQTDRALAEISILLAEGGENHV